jgi:hypothetical protein
VHLVDLVLLDCLGYQEFQVLLSVQLILESRTLQCLLELLEVLDFPVFRQILVHQMNLVILVAPVFLVYLDFQVFLLVL